MIGKLDKRVTVYKKNKVSNGRGGWTTTRENLGTFWAALQPLNTKEILQYRKMESKANTRAFMRFNPVITDDCEIDHGEWLYDIETVGNPSFNDYMEILAVGEKK